MEGYFWRFSDVASGRVVIAICGACRAPDGQWALVAIAAHPGGFQRWEVVPHCELSADRLGIRAGDALAADERSVRVRIGDASLEARIEPVAPWPRRSLGALGVAQLIPALGQYWHPHLLLGRTAGRAVLGADVVSLDGATAYAEKN